MGVKVTQYVTQLAVKRESELVTRCGAGWLSLDLVGIRVSRR